MNEGKSGGGSKQQARYIDPPNILRQKIGYGGIEPLRLQRAEDYINENPVDFGVIALGLMEKLDKTITIAKSGKMDEKAAIERLTHPIMELKANGGMFRYMLVSEIADIVLNFLENIEELNKDVFEIIEAHQRTLNTIIMSRLQGSGGKEGRALATELYDACTRYYKKHKIKLKG